MKILIKYKNMSVLVNDDFNIQEFSANADKIYRYFEKKSAFARNILSQNDKDINELDTLKAELWQFIVSSGAVGFPFDNKDAELYALNNDIEYQILELK